MKFGALCGLCGSCLFLFAIGYQVVTFGTEWKFGRYGMQESIIVNGHYANGTAVDPVTLSVAKSGYEQEVLLAMWVFVAVVGFYAWRLKKQGDALREKNRGK